MSSHGFSAKLGLDASGAKRGASQYAAAIDRVVAATKNLDKVLSATSAAMKKSSFSKIARDLAKLGSVKISPSLAKKLTAISQALRTLKGPSSSAIKRTTSLFRAIAKAKINASVAKNLANFSRAMATYKGPSAGATKNTVAFFRALSKAKISSSLASNFKAIAIALKGFRAPSSSAVKNIQRLATALRQIKVPRGLSSVAASINKINPTFRTAASSSSRFGGSLRTIPWRQASSGAKNLTGSMRGLENSFNGSFQAGSQLRTLFGALTVGTFTSTIFEATLTAERFATVLNITSDSLEQTGKIIETTRRISRTFGISLPVVYEEFGKFATSARLAGASLEETLFIFETFSGAARTLGLNAEDQRLVFLALTQMFSKGKISAEELRRQLGEKIPGAIVLLQNALRKMYNDPNLSIEKLLQEGKVGVQGVLLLTKEISDKFAPQFTDAMNRADTSVGNLANTWFDFQVIVGKSGAFSAMGDFAKAVDEVMRTEDFQSIAVAIGEGMGNAIRVVTRVVVKLLTNMRSILQLAKPFLAFFAAKGLITFGLSIGSILVKFSGLASLLKVVTGALFGVSAAAKTASFSLATLGGPVVIAIALGAAALATFWNETVKVGDTTVTVGEIAQVVWGDVVSALQFALGVVIDSTSIMMEAVSNWWGVADEGAQTNGKMMNVWGNGVIRTVLLVGRSFTLVLGAAINSVNGSLRVLAISLYQIANVDFVGAAMTLKQGAADAFKGAASFIDESVKIMEDALDKDSVGNLDLSYLTDGLTGYSTSVEQAILKNRQLAEEAKRSIEDLPEYVPVTAEPADPTEVLIDYTPGGGDGLSALGQSIKTVEDAMKAFEAQQTSLDARLAAGTITIRQYTDALDFQKGKLEEVVDPYAALIRAMQQEINLQNMGKSERSAMEAFLAKKNQLLEQGVILTQAQTEELKNLIAVQQQMSNSPFQSWVDGIEDFGVAAEKVGVKAMNSLTDSLADLIVDGKADWASMFKGILKDLIKLGLNQIWKQLFSGDAAPQINIAAPLTGAAGVAALVGTQQPNVMATAVAQGITLAGGIGGDAALGGLSLTGGGIGANANESLPDFLSAFYGGGGSGANVNESLPDFLSAFYGGGGSSGGSGAGGTLGGFNNSLAIGGGGFGANTESLDSFLTNFYGKSSGGGGGPTLPSGITDALESGMESLTTEINQISDQFSVFGKMFDSIKRISGIDKPVDLVGNITGGSASNLSPQIGQLQSLITGGGSSAPIPVTMPDSIFDARTVVKQISNLRAPGGQDLTFGGNFRNSMGNNTVDPRLMQIMQTTAANQNQFGVEAISGVRRSGSPNHDPGKAMDIQLTDLASGRVLDNYQNGPDFRAYEQFAQQARQTQLQDFPELTDKFRFGGYFSGNKEGQPGGQYGALDSMHFDTRGNEFAGSGMGGGSFASGLSAQQQSYFPGAQSVGMGQFANQVNPDPAAYGGGLGIGNQLAPAGMGGLGGGMGGTGLPGLPGGLGMGEGGGGGGGDIAGLGDQFTQEMETAFSETAIKFPDAMEPGIQQAAQLLPDKLTEDEGLSDSLTNAMEPANQQTAQDFTQQYKEANSQVAQDFASKMQNAGGGGGDLGGGGGGGGLGSIFSIISGFFKSGGIVGSGGSKKGMVPMSAFKGARSMAMGGIVGDPNAEPIIAHKGELVTPANQVAAMRRKGKSAALTDNNSVNAYSKSVTNATPAQSGGEDSFGGFSGAQYRNNTSTINMTINTPDADSFRASKGQIEAEMGNMQARASRRNS